MEGTEQIGSKRFASADSKFRSTNFEPPMGTVGEFWAWAFSDLMFNNLRGVFAEWMVARLLDIPLKTRDAWGEYDLVADGRVPIEVKASAYLQSWRPKELSAISFGGLKGKKWDMKTNTYAPEATFNAEIYVFCVQIEKNAEKWNALELDQWRFYVLGRKILEDRKWRSISLSTLKKFSHEMRAKEFQTNCAAIIREITESN